MQYNPPTGAAGANDPYVGKNTAAGIQGSKVPPPAVEFPQREIVNFIAATGQTPTNDDLSQMLKGARTNALTYYTDTGTADALVINPNPAFTVVPVGTEFALLKGTAANATATPTLAVNNVGPVPLKKEDGSALVAGDLPANVLLIVRFVANTYRIVGLRKSDATAAAANSTTIPVVTQQYIDKSSPRGATILSAFISNVAANDIVADPNGDTVVLTSGTFTGATYIDLKGSCSMRSTETTNNFVGFVATLRLENVTDSTSVTAAEYIGGGSQLGGTNQVQLGLSFYKTFQGLNPAKTYRVSVLCHKSAAYGPVRVLDPRITGYHDGT